MELSDPLRQFDPRSDVRGREFELLCRWYVRNAPEYRNRFREVWLTTSASSRRSRVRDPSSACRCRRVRFHLVTAVIYSTGFCPYCFLARRTLERHGIDYEERRMRRADRALLAPLGGGLTFPQIQINGRVVDGLSELRRLERDGELERLLAGE
jgi:glutaredoxin 3